MKLLSIIDALVVNFKGICCRKKHETFLYNGEYTTLYEIFAKICRELNVPRYFASKISDSLYYASADIRKKRHETNMPYEALVAYFAAEACLSLELDFEIEGSDLDAEQARIYSDKFKDHGDWRK
jgi:hypothetical protein